MTEWTVLVEEQMRYGRKIPVRDLHSADANVAGDVRYGGCEGHDPQYHGDSAQDISENFHAIALLEDIFSTCRTN